MVGGGRVRGCGEAAAAGSLQRARDIRVSAAWAEGGTSFHLLGAHGATLRRPVAAFVGAQTRGRSWVVHDGRPVLGGGGVCSRGCLGVMKAAVAAQDQTLDDGIARWLWRLSLSHSSG